jgi:hypothetical protein
MAKRPFTLTCLAGGFLFLAATMPLQVILLYGHGLSEWTAIAAKLTAFNWFVLWGFVVNAILLWRVSPLLRVTIPALIAGVVVNNWIAGYYATDFSLWTTTLGTLAFSVMNIPLLDDHVQWIMRHPERRWWIRAPRTRLAVPVLIEGAKLNSLKAETFDLSETGVFIAGANDVGVGDWIHVRMQFNSLAQIRCQGRVVRRDGARGIYPPGIGVQFMDMSWRQRRELKRWLERGGREDLHLQVP